MSVRLYGPHDEVLVDEDAQKAHLSNLTRAVLMVLTSYGNSVEAKLHDGLAPVVRAHLQEQLEAVEELLAALIAGAVALGFLETGSEDGVPQ